jgi:hypothetical protein
MCFHRGLKMKIIKVTDKTLFVRRGQFFNKR